jgi:DNA topoisomerase III
MKILCVAEKPSIARSVTQTLSGGRFTTSDTRIRYIKNFKFTARFPNWGDCEVVFTSVLGHLLSQDFDSPWRGWQQCSPSALFQEARIITTITEVLPSYGGR